MKLVAWSGLRPTCFQVDDVATVKDVATALESIYSKYGYEGIFDNSEIMAETLMRTREIRVSYKPKGHPDWGGCLDTVQLKGGMPEFDIGESR